MQELLMASLVGRILATVMMIAGIGGLVFILFHGPGIYTYTRRKDAVCSFIARRLLPSRVIYHVGVRLWAHGTTGEYSNEVVPGLLMADAIKRWGRDKGVQ